jgi:tetratricopeptide (TPR) repeat protein
VLARLRFSLVRLLRNGYALVGLVLLLFWEVARVAGRYVGATGAAIALGVLVSLFAIHWFRSRQAYRRVVKHSEAAERALIDGKYPEALHLATQALEIAQARKFSAGDMIAAVLAIRSEASHKMGKNDDALADAARAFACMCAVQTLDVQLMVLDQLGTLLLEMGHERRAIPILEAAVSLGQCSEEQARRAIGRLERMGMAYLRVGVHANAVAAFGKVIEILTREFGADARNLASPYINLGNGYKRMEKRDDAERCYREAFRLYQINGVNDCEKVSVALLNIGVLCAETGRVEEAEKYYQQVLDMRIRDLGRNHWRVGNTYNNLANCRRRLRDFTAAHAYVQQAIEILENRPESLSNAIGTRSQILEDEGRLEEALAEAARAREVQQNLSSPDLSELATLFEREGALAGRLDDPERAADCRAHASQVRQALAAAPPPNRDLANVSESLRMLEQHLASSLDRVKALQQAS